MKPPARWLSQFGLLRPPFSKDLGADELWVPPSRDQIVERLVEACQEKAHVVLTG